MSKVSEDIAPAKFYRCLFGGGTTDLTPTRYTLTSYILVSFQHIAFKLGIFSEFKTFFIAV